MTLFDGIREFRKFLSRIDLDDVPEAAALLAAMESRLESLIINAQAMAEFKGWVRGFILIGDEWFPVNVLNETQNGWCEWRVDEDGAVSSGVSMPGKWAWCSADNTPCLPDINEVRRGSG